MQKQIEQSFFYIELLQKKMWMQIHFRHSNLQATVKVNMFYVRLTRITENKLIAQVRIIDIHSKRPLAKPHWTCYASRHIAEPIEPSVLQCQLYLR